MADRYRPGFTLVELLVVVVIISMLVGLLLPAVIGARARARQTQCSNNQRELALALQQYEVAKDHLPGYINNFATAGNLSWVVVVLPHLGREDLWAEWREPTRLTPPIRTYDTKRTNFMVDMPQLKCPSDSPPETAGALSYVANCGIAAGAQTAVPPGSSNMRYEGPAHGVFHNRAVANPITIQSERIPDGASQTLLLSENIQATQWAPPQIDPSDPASPWTGLVDPVAGPDWREAHVGMVWWTAPLITSYYLAQGGDPRWVPPNNECYRINRCRDEEPSALDLIFARPSSLHTDGVVVTYCDGHQDFLFDDVDYDVLRRQMAADDDKAGL